ncbi:GerAB/ArcD/ProY family transporter, partial [Acinetobacter baumannii]|uniref:GerAB/ArcD/ProY family transporter n=1 Tax=Acinetobacter baumannii TaxID=470 RepID=UPI002FE21EE8
MIGSTTLYELGIEAKQDAWLVVLVAMITGMLLLFIYLYIQNQNSEHALPQILNQHFGKYLGSIITAAYIVYFAYESMRNTREFADIINISFLPSTPLYFLILLMVLLSG